MATPSRSDTEHTGRKSRQCLITPPPQRQSTAPCTLFRPGRDFAAEAVLVISNEAGTWNVVDGPGTAGQALVANTSVRQGEELGATDTYVLAVATQRAPDTPLPPAELAPSGLQNVSGGTAPHSQSSPARVRLVPAPQPARPATSSTSVSGMGAPGISCATPRLDVEEVGARFKFEGHRNLRRPGEVW
jgi:hypothetical protein